MTYGTEKLYDEVAYVAFHFHWAHDEILDLEHADRRRFVDQIGRMTARNTYG